jgi:hypothetical protein
LLTNLSLYYRFIRYGPHDIAGRGAGKGTVRLVRVNCPVSEKARLWTEESLGWLCSQFGDHALRSEVLAPQTVFPPGSYARTQDDVSVVLPAGASDGPPALRAYSRG